MPASHKLVLASGSPRRLELLQQIGQEPDFFFPVQADETPKKGEAPRSLAKRLAREKAEIAFESIKHSDDMSGSYVLAADTVVGLGRRVLPKAELLDEAAHCLQLLSGRNHRVYTGVTLATPKGTLRHRLVETRMRFKRLSRVEMEAYLASGEWRGKAGGYAIQGIASAFTVKLVGSYSNVVGLPLYETMSLLVGEGFQVHYGWTATS